MALYTLCCSNYNGVMLSMHILGEFGIVYKGYIMKSSTKSVDEYLAIKTLKGVYKGYA